MNWKRDERPLTEEMLDQMSDADLAEAGVKLGNLSKLLADTDLNSSLTSVNQKINALQNECQVWIAYIENEKMIRDAGW